MNSHRQNARGRRFLLRAAGIPLLLALSSCGSEAATEPDLEGLRVLFIGNSLTYTNDLPGVLSWDAGPDRCRRRSD